MQLIGVYIDLYEALTPIKAMQVLWQIDFIKSNGLHERKLIFNNLMILSVEVTRTHSLMCFRPCSHITLCFMENIHKIKSNSEPTVSNRQSLIICFCCLSNCLNKKKIVSKLCSHQLDDAHKQR